MPDSRQWEPVEVLWDLEPGSLDFPAFGYGGWGWQRSTPPTKPTRKAEPEPQQRPARQRFAAEDEQEAAEARKEKRRNKPRHRKLRAHELDDDF